jgi:2-polyprenyl-6-methoxyphenol hydroxylase-like FAD-dependent oxidoreductase
MAGDIYDVVIVGYGPTGMLAAIKLGRAGHRVAVLERYKTLYNLPRVGIVHDDVLRMFQEIEIWHDIEPATFFLPVYELANKGEVLLSNTVATLATHGWPEMTSIYQPAFEAVLDMRAKALPSVDVFQGARVTAVAQDDETVTATVDEDGAMREVRGRYLIGADGGNSFVRDALGIGLEDLGFDQNWLVIDATPKKPPRTDLPLLRQFCEPEQPGMTMQMGPSHRRWSFQIFPGETPEDAVKPDSVWRRLDRLEGATPDEFELIRVVSYKFQSLLADRWRAGRIVLAGDAVHQMPPFLAQGLCSGFRDAYNIAWKLDMVLGGKASADFLDTYEAERGPNARATVIESLRVGQNVNETDPDKARARDDQLRAMQAEMEKSAGDKKLIGFRVPGFEQGFVCRAAGGTVKGAGDAFGQGRVRKNGNEGLFDDVAGRGFMILARGGDPAAALSDGDAAFWRALGGDVAEIGNGGLEDVDGVYTRMMDAYGCDVIVKRPDYYMFAACGLGDLPAVLGDMRRQLG